MKNKLILLPLILLVLSSCFFDKKEDLTIIENKETIKDSVNKKESGSGEINTIKEDKEVNEMTDTKNEDEAVEEFEKDVEDILKLLEDNG